jgi:hypothetical protein
MTTIINIIIDIVVIIIIIVPDPCPTVVRAVLQETMASSIITITSMTTTTTFIIIIDPDPVVWASPRAVLQEIVSSSASQSPEAVMGNLKHSLMQDMMLTLDGQPPGNGHDNAIGGGQVRARL